ncbi:unnamed protein product [Rotaria magnacalcarata]
MPYIKDQSNNETGIPDVANAAVDLTSNISAEGGSVGRRVLASRHNGLIIKSMESQKICDDENLKIKYEKILEFSHENDLSWFIRLDTDSLYVEIPEELSEGSKEKFLSLLEFADDTLHCKHLIIYFDKGRTDRAMVVKTFMFLGFHILSPDNTLMKDIDKKPDQLFMVYTIDGDE